MSLRLLAEHAKELLSAPAGWDAYDFKSVGDVKCPTGCLVTGAVAPLFAKGKLEGRKDWKKRDPATVASVVISNKDHDAWLKKIEAAGGFCATCNKTGMLKDGYSKYTGTKYKPCSDCGGTGIRHKGAGSPV